MERVKTPGQLSAALKRAIKPDDMIAIVRKLATDGMRMLIRRSAVDSGYLRSRWGFAVGSDPGSDPTVGVKGKKYTAKTPSVRDVTLGERVTMYNNTAYAKHLEEGTPHMSAQPMVEPTRIYLESVAREVCSQLSRKKSNV